LSDEVFNAVVVKVRWVSPAVAKTSKTPSSMERRETLAVAKTSKTPPLMVCHREADWRLLDDVEMGHELGAGMRMERKGKWAVFFPAWPEPGEGRLCTCMLGARRYPRMKREYGNVQRESSMI